MHGVSAAPVGTPPAGSSSQGGSRGSVSPLHPHQALTRHPSAAELIPDQQTALLSLPPWHLLSHQEVLQGQLLWDQLLWGQLLWGQLLWGQLLWGQLLWGQLLWGQLLGGQLLWGQLLQVQLLPVHLLACCGAADSAASMGPATNQPNLSSAGDSLLTNYVYLETAMTCLIIIYLISLMQHQCGSVEQAVIEDGVMVVGTMAQGLSEKE